MSSAILITARINSTRLPKKALLTLYGKTTLIEHIIMRAKQSLNSDEIILCTTLQEEDKELCEIADSMKILHYRGSTEDKLNRWLGAVNQYQIDHVVTMDGDDPFCMPDLVDLAFTQLENGNGDFIEKTGIISGLFTYAFRTTALKKVCEIKDSENTEMMWTYFKDTGLFNIEELKQVSNVLIRSDQRLTLDYEEDLFLFRKIFSMIPGEYNIEVTKVIELLAKSPDLNRINYFRQNEFLTNQSKKTVLSLKENYLEKL